LKFRSKEHGVAFGDKKRPPSSSVAALALSRVLQAKATREDDPELMEVAKDVETRALASIKLHLPVLPEKPRQLRLPGL
jgi:hypothetical protein